MEIDLNKRYQTMITLWAALLMSVFLYFLVTVFAASQVSRDGNQPSTPLIFALTAVGALFVIISFAVKRKLLQQSVDKQDVGLVQKAMIIACALCEASALLGLVERFVVGGREYYLLFLLAGVGIALHFPRRSQLEAAQWRTIKSSTQIE